jgi:hypothetical protein
LPDGTRDLSFGTDGSVIDRAHVNEPPYFPQVALGTDGSIVLYGDDHEGDQFLRRFQPNGEADPKFTGPVPDVASFYNDADHPGTITNLGIDANGLPIVMISSDKSLPFFRRYGADGNVRSATKHLKVSDTSLFQDVRTIRTDAKGGMWMTGEISNDFSNAAFLLHYRRDGRLDTSFGSDGMVHSIGEVFALDPADRPIAAGESYDGQSIRVARYSLRKAEVASDAEPLDVRISAVKLPFVLNGGETLKGRATVRLKAARGQHFTGDATIRLLLSTDAAVDDSDPVTATLTRHVRLRGGHQVTLKVPISEIATTAGGDYHLLADVAVDGARSTAAAADPIRIARRQSDVFVKATASAGTIDVTIANAGNVRFSRNATLILYGEPHDGGPRFTIQTIPVAIDLPVEQTVQFTLSTAGVSRDPDSYGLTVFVAGAADDDPTNDFDDRVLDPFH